MVVVGPQTEVVTFQTPTKLFQAGRRDVSGSGGNEGCAAAFCRGVMPLVPVISRSGGGAALLHRSGRLVAGDAFVRMI